MQDACKGSWIKNNYGNLLQVGRNSGWALKNKMAKCEMPVKAVVKNNNDRNLLQVGGNIG